MRNPAAIVIVLFIVFLSGCLNLDSDTSKDIDVISHSPSPKNSYIATSYRESGGGAAGWCFVYVNMRKAEAEFNAGSNVVFATQCAVEPELQWKDEQSLKVVYPDSANVYTQLKAWRTDKTVEINYEAK